MSFDTNPTILKLRAQHKARREAAVAIAAKLWAKMDADQKFAVSFGVFPQANLAGARRCGAAPQCLHSIGGVHSKNGGMRA